MHRLRAFPDDVTYMFADREVVRNCDAEYFDDGGTRNIRQCCWQVTFLKLAPAAGKYYFQRFCPIKLQVVRASPLFHMF